MHGQKNIKNICDAVGWVCP